MSLLNQPSAAVATRIPVTLTVAWDAIPISPGLWARDNVRVGDSISNLPYAVPGHWTEVVLDCGLLTEHVRFTRVPNPAGGSDLWERTE